MGSSRGKVWGVTTEVFASRHVEVHLLAVRRGGLCSQHRHARKDNLFHVISGRVLIRTWPSAGAGPDATALGPGEECRVEAGVWHQFEALEDSAMIEVYEASGVGEDIERRTQGGVLPPAGEAGLP